MVYTQNLNGRLLGTRRWLHSQQNVTLMLIPSPMSSKLNAERLEPELAPLAPEWAPLARIGNPGV
jgi:hypothetical protein